jgi:alpha-tubulin suppressor-like RCC1 family protein
MAYVALAPRATAQSGVVVRGAVSIDSGLGDESLAGIAAGPRETLLLRADGTLTGWGESVQTIPASPPGSTYVEAAVGGLNAWWSPPGEWWNMVFRVARRSDGSVIAWGDNSKGQCDVPALPAGLSYVEVAAGGWHCLARRSDGSVIGFGRNWSGECDVPALPAGLTYVEIAAGGGGSHDYWATLEHSVARRSDGSVVAWGSNSHGQCNVPALPPGLTYVEIAASGLFTLARRSDGSVLAWGDNSSGQCNVPALPPGLSYVRIAAGWNHSVALRSDGSGIAWGDNGSGQCNFPALPPGSAFIDVSAGAAHTVARRADGPVVAWGANESLQCSLPPCPVGVSYIDLATGGSHYLPYPYNAKPRHFWVFLRSDGIVRAWGDDSHGECDLSPAPLGLNYVEIAAGAKHTLARLSDGSVIAAGASTVPTPPSGLTYVEIAAGGRITDFAWDSPGHSLGRLSDGTVFAWGDNTYGQCDVPALPPGLTYVGVAAGGYHSLALRSDGSAVGWGPPSAPQCDVPALPSGLTYVGLAAGTYHSLARRSDGSVVAWGGNGDGQCNVPALPSGVTYVEIAAGEFHSVARRSDGVAVAWGRNNSGQCNIPALSSGLVYTAIEAGFQSTMLSYGPGPGFIRSYCVAGTSSNGCVPSIDGTGAASGSSGSGFTITVDGLDGQRSCMIFYGIDNSGFIPTTWATGSTSFLCVKPSLQRTLLQSSGGTRACDGVLSIDWNAYVASHGYALGVPFANARNVYAQACFRDPLAPKGSNLSNALVFRVCP